MTSSLFPRSGAFGDGKWALWGVGGLLVFMLLLRTGDIFAGQIPGIDDMMRLQQVRDLLAGQGWFNVDQARLLTPEGGEMHWSRLPDIFLSAIILIARPLMGQEAAEMLALSLWPILLMIAALSLIAMAMQRLGFSRAGQVLGLIFFGTSAAVYNFWPGRIDHHNLVVVLTLGGVVAALSRTYSARSGVVLALCVTAMLSVALEGLPYVAGLVAMMGLFWIARGHLESVRLASFGFALMVFSTGFYLLDAPGWGERRMVCDAYGTSHWLGLVTGGALLALLGIFGGWFDNWQKRLGIGVLAGGVTLAITIGTNPACLGDPYAAVPDTVRLAWLSVVGEAKTLPKLIESELDRVFSVFGFLMAASVACGLLVFKAKPEDRLARIGFALLFALAILATTWQIRGQSFSGVFAAIAAGGLAGQVFLHWWKQRGSGPMLQFAAVALLMSPMSWQIASKPLAKPLAYSKDGKSYRVLCTDPEAYRRLATYPEMKVFTSIDLGISVLARTPHSVFVGPYHRNVDGIERVADILAGAPEEARGKLAEMGATHLLYCQGLNETNRYGLLWPEGFAAALNQREMPDWLRPADGLVETDGVVRLYRIEAQ